MNVVSRTPRYVYLKTGLDPALYEALVRRFDGNDNLALRTLRQTFTSAVDDLLRRPPTSYDRVL